MKYEIYQLLESKSVIGIRYMSLDRVKRGGEEGKLRRGNYCLVYSGEITPEKDETAEDMLERIFWRFNREKPQDFSGHSVSVSDVIALENDAWYCDSVGFQRLERFWEEPMQLFRWISTRELMPKAEEPVVMIASGNYGNIELHNAILIGIYSPEEGWIANEFPECDNLQVTMWASLPMEPLWMTE